MATELERRVYVQWIDPEYHEEYLDAHDNVPSGVSEAMIRGGVERFETYVRGRISVCILEAHDIDEYLDEIEGNKAVEDWERYVGQFKEEGVDIDSEDESIPFMEPIWTLEGSTEVEETT